MTNTFLLNDFYTIVSSKKTERGIQAEILLNSEHAIFKGHFEQMPVVPGVCQTQIIKELIQQEINKELILTAGNNIKFTGMIIPTTHSNIQVEINYTLSENQCNAEAQLFFENIIFTKFKGTFLQN